MRVISSLFKSANPSAHPEGFLADVNPNSMDKYKNAMVDIGFDEIKRRAPWPAAEGEKSEANAGEARADGHIINPETVRFQGMRVAYFAMDSDSTEDNIVLNRIVALKEEAGK